MKNDKALFSGAVIVALTLFSATSATAHTTRSRPASGVVENLDMQIRTVTFSPANGKAPIEYGLTRQTEFIHNRHFVTASELKTGTKAVVYYRTPFFGKPFVTKIVWINGA